MIKNKITHLVAKVDDIWLLYKIFCHVNFDSIVKTSSMFAVRDLPKIVKPTNTICKEYILVKNNKNYFPIKKFTMKIKLEIVYIDLNGPTKTKEFYGEMYFMILVDDFF